MKDRVMAGYVIPEEELYKFIGHLIERQPVMGPMERPDQPGFYVFDWLERPEDFVPEYVTTTMPPKKAFFPPSQTLYTFALNNPPELTIDDDHSRFVLAGVHPCDLAAIDELDAAYSYPPAEQPWPAARKRATIIGIDCMPDEYCFCTTVNTCDSRAACDVFLTKIKRGYLAEAHTAAGREMLKGAGKTKAGKDDLLEAKQWRSEKIERTTAKFEATIGQFADILEEGGLAEVWQEVAGRCYSCGSCNTTCPTCFCYDMSDELDFSLASGVRRRTWDSCQLLEFALVAGEYNFRGERWQRVRHRWHRKFLYLYRKYGRPYCTGCGRCSRACTVDINIVDVSNQIISYSRKGAAGA